MVQQPPALLPSVILPVKHVKVETQKTTAHLARIAPRELILPQENGLVWRPARVGCTRVQPIALIAALSVMDVLDLVSLTVLSANSNLEISTIAGQTTGATPNALMDFTQMREQRLVSLVTQPVRPAQMELMLGALNVNLNLEIRTTENKMAGVLRPAKLASTLMTQRGSVSLVMPLLMTVLQVETLAALSVSGQQQTSTVDGAPTISAPRHAHLDMAQIAQLKVVSFVMAPVISVLEVQILYVSTVSGLPQKSTPGGLRTTSVPLHAQLTIIQMKALRCASHVMFPVKVVQLQEI